MIFATVAGNVGKDAELRKTADGASVLSFGLAVERREGGEKVTQWVDVSIWGKRGESLASYITKGSKLVAVGDLTLTEKNGKTYLKLSVHDLTLQGGVQRSDPAARQAPDRSADSGRRDEIPF